MRKFTLFTSAFLVLLLFFSCNKDEDRTPSQVEMDKVIAIHTMLQDNNWGFIDYRIKVDYEIEAPLILANVADENGMVQAGTYDAYDIFGNGDHQEYYNYQFINNKLKRDTTGNNTFNDYGLYFVMSSKEIWLNPENVGFMQYEYSYNDENGNFIMTAPHGRNEKVVNLLNNIVTNSILKGTPGDIADAVIDKLLGNDKVSEKINQILYDLIHGKIADINQNPEDISAKLAPIIVNKLKDVDWESMIEGKLVEILEKIKAEDPEAKAQELAVKIANVIETIISEGAIYNIILPILQNFENETLPTLAPVLSEAIYNLIQNKLTEDILYEKIYPLWTKYTEIDSLSIVDFADTLGSVVTNKVFDNDSLTLKLTPFMEELEGTSVIKLPGMAQDIIDDILKPLVDNINNRFPDADIDPKWAVIKTGVIGGLTALKTTIGDGPDAIAEASASLANMIIGLMDTGISKGFATAFFKLQDIPADQASTTLSIWIVNLIEIAEDPILGFLTEKLEELIDLFNAEAVAEKLSEIIHNKIVEILSPDKIYDLIYPILVKINDSDTEIAAAKITEWLFDLNIVKDNITEEQVTEKLTVILIELLSNIDVDKSSELLTDLILNSNLVQNIDGSLLSKVLELKIYQFLFKISRSNNAIDNIETTLIRK